MPRGPDLLLLERLTPEHLAPAFQRLPFAIVAPGARSAPGIVAAFENFPEDQCNLLRGIDWLLAESVHVINLSLGLPGASFDRYHPLQIATHFATDLGVPVVTAAGNDGPAPGTLQPLAQAPWVIAVGATDADGRLLASSSRGTPDGAKPTVVADGTIDEPDPRFPEPATSFAAPKVAQITTFVQRCLFLLIQDLADQFNDAWGPLSRPVQMPVVGIADTGCDPSKIAATVPPLAASILDQGDSVRVSRGDRERQWYAGLMRGIREHGAELEISSDVASVRRCLQLMAKPLPGRAPFEAGAGLVSPAIAAAFMASLTPSRLIDGFSPALRHELPAGAFEELDRTLGPLWDEHKVSTLMELFVGGIRTAVAKVL